jgi:hypothetical protein
MRILKRLKVLVYLDKLNLHYQKTLLLIGHLCKSSLLSLIDHVPGTLVSLNKIRR